MTTLPELSRRVSEAEGPSRELDAEIAKALGWREVGSGAWIRPDGRQNIGVQSYTASLDVVCALIAEKLPGRAYIITHGRLSESEPLGAAGIFSDMAGGDPHLRFEAATTVLALLAAALLAIHERKGPSDE